MKRYVYDDILKDLRKKMVFVTGSRQVGKTFLARQLMQSFKSPQYLNYDSYNDQKIIHSQTWDNRSDLLVFDEIHKMPNWKMFLKGVFDTRQDNQTFLITGSARMDTFRQSGESLAGRYFHYHLHPFSVSELINIYPLQESLEKIMHTGGFPEPFLEGTITGATRWRKQYYTDLVREDVVEFSRIHEVRLMRMLLEALRYRVGSPLSLNSLSEDFQVSHGTIRRYIEILESLHIILIVRPYHKNIARALVKEPKLYFFDSGFTTEESTRLENTVALALKKHVDYQNDAFGHSLTLHYLRDKEKREVDFMLAENEKPVMLIEVKCGDETLSTPLKYYHARFPEAQAVQLVLRLRQPRNIHGIRLVRAADWLAELSAWGRKGEKAQSSKVKAESNRIQCKLFVNGLTS